MADWNIEGSKDERKRLVCFSSQWVTVWKQAKKKRRQCPPFLSWTKKRNDSSTWITERLFFGNWKFWQKRKRRRERMFNFLWVKIWKLLVKNIVFINFPLANKIFNKEKEKKNVVGSLLLRENWRWRETNQQLFFEAKKTGVY